MTEDVEIGGAADQKLQSQLYIGKSRGTYHLHGKTANSSWKIKWFVPFRLQSFRKFGL